MSSLEDRFNQLEESVRKHIDQATKIAQVQAAKDQALLMEKSLEAHLQCIKDQTKVFEQSIQTHKASYAEAVKGTCTELEKTVKTQLASIPRPNVGRSNRDAQDLSKVLDDHLDKERRKGNVVVHNLPEQAGDTLSDRSAKDVSEFSSMIRDVMKLNVSASKSFRVGKKNQNRPRLLIVTLDNPSAKHDILRGAPELRHTTKYSNVYLTPDLTQKEREAGRKLREELAGRRRAGETNLVIRGGKITRRDLEAHQMVADRPTAEPAGGRRDHAVWQESSADEGDEAATDSASAVPVCGSRGQAEKPQPEDGTGRDETSGAPAVPVCGSRRQAEKHKPEDGTEREETSGAPAVPVCGSRRQAEKHKPEDGTEREETSGAPAVPVCGSRRQVKETSTKRNPVMDETAAAKSGAKDQPARHQ